MVLQTVSLGPTSSEQLPGEVGHPKQVQACCMVQMDPLGAQAPACDTPKVADASLCRGSPCTIISCRRRIIWLCTGPKAA